MSLNNKKLHQNEETKNSKNSIPEYEMLYPPLKESFVYDENNEIHDNILNIKSTIDNSKNNNYSLEDDVSDNLTENFLSNLVKKPCHLSREKIIKVISKFIKQSKLIKKIAVEYQSEKKISENELSTMCAEKFSYMLIKQGEILFKIGDTGDRFYFILSGKITILKLKETIATMTYMDYLLYCIFLIDKKEEYILSEVLKNNCKILAMSNEGEIQKLYKIVFKKKLIESIHLELIKNNSSLKLFFNNYNQTFKNYNLEVETLEYLQKKKWGSGGSEWESYITKNCKLTVEEATFFEPFEKILTDKKLNNVKCYNYEAFLYLGPGLFFGDTALDSEINKRNATIRAEENTVLAYLLSTDYKNMISSKHKIEQLKDIDFLFYYFFFQDINYNFFQRNYFHLFSPHEYNRDNILFIHGTIPESLIFISKGKISLEFSGSILDIQNILKYIYTHILNNPLFQQISTNNRTKLISNEVLNSIRNYANDQVLLRLKTHNINFINEVKKIRTHQIKLLSKNEVIGLEEIYLKLPYLMKATVSSENVYAFELGLDYLDKIINNEKEVIYPFVKYSINKLLAFVERIQSIKQNYINMYLKEEKEFNMDKNIDKTFYNQSIYKIINKTRNNHSSIFNETNEMPNEINESTANENDTDNTKTDFPYATIFNSTRSPVKFLITKKISSKILNKFNRNRSINTFNKISKKKITIFDKTKNLFDNRKNNINKSNLNINENNNKNSKNDSTILIGSKRLSIIDIQKSFNEIKNEKINFESRNKGVIVNCFPEDCSMHRKKFKSSEGKLIRNLSNFGAEVGNNIKMPTIFNIKDKMNVKENVTKKELISGKIKTFYNVIKLNGYSYLANNKGANMFYQRKYNKKYISAEKIKKKNRLLPKIL